MPVIEKCKSCHQQQFSEWKYGPHGITYKQIFLDPKHNRERPLMDDCLRCHGMHFEGGIHDLVDPVDRKGPWAFKNAAVTNDPAIPCLTCHSIHSHGEPASNRAVRSQERARPSLALFDRRDMQPSIGEGAADSGHDGRRPPGEDEPRPAHGPLYPMPCRGLDHAGPHR